MSSVKDWIKKDEGFRSHPYLDTVKKVTIGYGRNIDDNGITEEEAEFLLDNDIARCRKELAQFPWYYLQPPGVQDALLNMCFNLGIARLSGFRKMIAALEARNYTQASKEALDSKWATQVPNRAKSVAVAIRAGI